MPLYKRKPFPQLETPDDLQPQELVFQVRFTKEIFRDYCEYLKRINLYRQRVWTCKVTGKSNLTYEESLVSEKRATEKVQKFPEELVVPVLRHVQFSMLNLKDLVNTAAAKLQEPLLEGSELYSRRNSRLYPCRVERILEDAGKTRYEIMWLDKDKKITGSAIVNGEDLIRKKLPFSRDVLKSFIRESTCRSIPWILHDKVARKHGISVDPPEELRGTIFLHNGCILSNRKKKKNEDRHKEGSNGELRVCKRRKVEGEMSNHLISVENGVEDDILEREPIKYPIDDLMVQPASDDPVFMECPSPCREFSIPMDFVGDLLMVWDFCSSFSKLLFLWPFPLEEFENALCYKDSNPILIVESLSALLRLLIKDNGAYFSVIEKRRRKPKISLITWTDFLCDFLEMVNIPQLSACISTIKRGHYGLLDIHAKLRIFRELINQALGTDIIRDKLDEYIEERQALGATKREKALEEARKKREDKERLKVESKGTEVTEGHIVESTEHLSEVMNHVRRHRQNGDDAGKKKQKALSSQKKNAMGNSRNDQLDTPVKKNARKQELDVEVLAESINDSFKKGAQKLQKLTKDDIKEAMKKRNEEQRKEYLEREMEKRFIRTNSLGKDRYYNRYWFFRRDGRIFVESSDYTQWGYYSTTEELDAFMGSLNSKGVRERALKKQLEKSYGKICSQLRKRSTEVAHRTTMEEEAVLRRSTRVRAPPRENPARSFLKYVNKWKED